MHRANSASAKPTRIAEEHRHAPRRCGNRPARGAAGSCRDLSAISAAARRRSSGTRRSDRPTRPASAVGRRSPSDVAQAVVDVGRLGRQGVGHRRDQERAKRECKQWKPERHGYTSILMTCLIQKNPIACMMIDAMIIIWPIRSSNRRFMCSGLMNDSATREKRRQRHQHVPGEPAVRGVHAHLPANLEALANDGGEVVEDLRQVAAGLALDEHGGREEPHVEQRHAQRTGCSAIP